MKHFRACKKFATRNAFDIQVFMYLNITNLRGKNKMLVANMQILKTTRAQPVYSSCRYRKQQTNTHADCNMH